MQTRIWKSKIESIERLHQEAWRPSILSWHEIQGSHRQNIQDQCQHPIWREIDCNHGEHRRSTFKQYGGPHQINLRIQKKTGSSQDEKSFLNWKFPPSSFSSMSLATCSWWDALAFRSIFSIVNDRNASLILSSRITSNPFFDPSLAVYLRIPLTSLFWSTILSFVPSRSF